MECFCYELITMIIIVILEFFRIFSHWPLFVYFGDYSLIAIFAIIFFCFCILVGFIIEIVFLTVKKFLTYILFSLIQKFSRSWTEEPEKRLDYFSTEEDLYSPYPQKYSMFLDFIFPYIIVILSFWPLFFNFHWIIYFIFILLHFILVTFPVINFWSLVRKWESLKIIYTLKNPNVIRYVFTGLVYPMFYVVFLSVLRFFAMGSTQIYDFSFFSVDISIYLVFLLPHLLLIFVFLLNFYKEVRLGYLLHFKFLFHSLHVYFLRSAIYKEYCRTVHKYNFAITELLWLRKSFHWYRKIKYPLFYQISWYLWRTNPRILYLLIPIFLILELIFTAKIYYGFYFIFIFFFLRLVLIIFRKWSSDVEKWNVWDRGFESDCCISNYFNEKSWDNPYYPKLFAHYLEFPEFSKNRHISYKKIEKVKELAQKVPKVPFYNYDSKTKKSFPQVLSRTALPCGRKIKLLYQHYCNQRWMHTSSSTHLPSKSLHPILPYLLQDLFSRLQMVSEASNWVNLYPKIQQAEKFYPSVPPKAALYSSNVPAIISQQTPISNLIKDQTEFNTLTAFSSWVKYGLKPTLHKSGTIYTNKVGQQQPYISVNAEEFLKKQVVLGFDVKVKSTESGSNLILGISKDVYIIQIDNFILRYARDLEKQAVVFLNKLKEIDNIEERLILYKDNLHWFIALGKFPPINLGKLVHEEYFSACYKDISFVHKAKLGLLSDTCYAKEPFKGNSLRQQTIALAQDPDIFAIKKDILDLLP